MYTSGTDSKNNERLESAEHNTTVWEQLQPFLKKSKKQQMKLLMLSITICVN